MLSISALQAEKTEGWSSMFIADAIRSYFYCLPILKLPRELILNISNHLPIEDLANFSKTCRIAKGIADASFRERAKEYGYLSSDSTTTPEAKKYLASLFEAVKSIKEKQFLLQDECIYTKASSYLDPSPSRLNYEQTLHKISTFTITRLRELYTCEGIFRERSSENLQVFLNLHTFLLERKSFYSLEPADTELQNKLDAQLIAAGCHRYYHTIAVRPLLDAGANPNVRNHHGETPLFDAIRCHSKETLELLLVRGADCNIVNSKGEAPLYLCVTLNNSETDEIALLIKWGANVNEKMTSNGNTALHQIFENNERYYEEAINVFLLGNADPNIRNLDGKTPLYLAAATGKKSALELLLENNGNPNIEDNQGHTPLTASIKDSNVVELLLDNGAQIDYQVPSDGNTALHLAVDSNQQQTIEVLLSKEANPNIKNDKGETPLHLAVKNGNREAVRLLLRNDADPNVEDNEGSTPFTHELKDADITWHLLKHGATIDHQVSNNGYTALHRAVKNGFQNTIVLLLSWKANPNIKDNKGKTPLHLAVKTSNKIAVELLLLNKADPNIKDKKGWTPLNEKLCDLDISELLFRNGAIASNPSRKRKKPSPEEIR